MYHFWLEVETLLSLTYSVPEAAKQLGISRTNAYALVRAGKLPAIRLGERVLIPRAALLRLLERAEQPVAVR